MRGRSERCDRREDATRIARPTENCGVGGANSDAKHCSNGPPGNPTQCYISEDAAHYHKGHTLSDRSAGASSEGGASTRECDASTSNSKYASPDNACNDIAAAISEGAN